ncbi:MAG: ABC transporter substrate-binding protein [Alphaproteobacteria bacterium]|nr:ABC transporter substrate-binding protein [Alphaproteobacteria bacterium]
MNRFFALLLLIIGVAPQNISAQEMIISHAIAMHGEPKHAANFKNFDYVNKDAPKGGTLRLNIVGTFDSLNPYIVKGRPAEGLSYIYETLLARTQDEPFTLYPLIAEKIGVRADRSAIRFYLNPKAHWQDEKPITADDVYFSWATLRDKGKPNHRSFYKKVASAEINDAHSITFTFKKSADGAIDREMPLIMGLMPILPKHMYQSKSFDETTLLPPIASGPYKIAAVEAGRSVIFERDKNYWGADLAARRGTSNFDSIRYDYYRDENVAQEAFTAHTLDARRETDPKRWSELQRLAENKRAQTKKDSFQTIAFTHRRPEPMRGFIFNTRRANFSDARVRKALSAAFDFEWINRTLFHGAYKWLDSYFANSDLASSGLPDEQESKLLAPWKKDLPAELFTEALALPRTDEHHPLRDNLRIASASLEEAGYRIKKGVLQTPTDQPFTFEILLSDPQDEKVALEYARTLNRIGVVARVRTVDASQFQARLSDFDYDMVLYKWINSLSPGNEQAQYWGSTAADIKGSRNYAGIKSPAVDDLTHKITSAQTREELRTAVHALDRVLLSGYYMVPLFYRGTDLFAIWPNVMIPQSTPLYGPVVESWWAK